MANEISVNAVIIEKDDGSYRSVCPDLGIESTGSNADNALRNLKDAVIKHITETGADKMRLSIVKCLKLKVSV